MNCQVWLITLFTVKKGKENINKNVYIYSNKAQFIKTSKFSAFLRSYETDYQNKIVFTGGFLSGRTTKVCPPPTPRTLVVHIFLFVNFFSVMNKRRKGKHANSKLYLCIVWRMEISGGGGMGRYANQHFFIDAFLVSLH